jgi:uncharacterized membrane protein
METIAAPGRALPKYKLHWHVLFVHFPISFFGVAFAFQFLHLFTSPACFELATNVTLIAGAAMLVPTIWSGWRTWKSNYRGARSMIFRRKINIAFMMLVFSAALLGWRIISFGAFVDVPYSPAHWVYLAGNTLLMAGAVAEGYYGGRLNHH